MLFIFGTAGMALAALGTYGLVSYTVKQSTHEIGIRMALGAPAASVVRQFLGRGLRLGAIGAALGSIAALGAARLLGSVLFGVSATDAALLRARAGHRPRRRDRGDHRSGLARGADQSAERAAASVRGAPMNTTAGGHPQQVVAERPLRLWPGVVIVALIVLVRYVIPFFIPEADFSGVLVGVAGAALILIWWLFFSRAPWSERIGALFVMAAAVIAIKPLVHASISNGFMGMMFYVYAVPSTVAPALVAWALFSRRLSKPARWATMIATMFLACGALDAAADQRDHRRCLGATGLALDPDRRRAAARAGRGRSCACRSCGAGASARQMPARRRLRHNRPERR